MQNDIKVIVYNVIVYIAAELSYTKVSRADPGFMHWNVNKNFLKNFQKPIDK